MRVVVELSFKGTKYAGWQIQNGQPTVQAVLQEKWAVLLQQAIGITGCGRTDAGVHASQFFLHFDAEWSKKSRITAGSLNALLPDDIAVKKVFQVNDDFHTRFHAYSRKYIYRVHAKRDPFLSDRSFFYSDRNLDIELMNSAVKCLEGMHDFSRFCKANSGAKNYICHVSEARWFQSGEYTFEFHITANRFLRGMVRLIVGMCLHCNNQKIEPDQVRQAFLQKQRIGPSWSVPPHGLHLVGVKYPVHMRAEWVPLDLGI